MKLNMILIVAVAIIVGVTLSSHDNGTSLIVKLGNMIHRYEHYQQMKEQETSLKEFFEKELIFKSKLLSENAGIVECPSQE